MITPEAIKRMEYATRDRILPFSPKPEISPNLNRVNEFSVNKVYEPSLVNYREAKDALRRGPDIQNPETGFLYRGKRRAWQMRRTEEKYASGESLGDLLHRLYFQDQKSAREIGEQLRVSDDSIGRWLRMAEIEVREWNPFANPMLREKSNDRRVAGIRRTYSKRKAEIVAKIHTPESDAKRSAAVKRWHAANPEKSREFAERGAKATIAKSNKKITDKLGNDPASVLRKELIEGRLSYNQMAEKYGLSATQITNAERKYLTQRRHGRGLIPSRQKEATDFKFFREILGDSITEFLGPSQIDVLNLVYPVGGQVQKYDEVASKRGVTKQAIQSTLARVRRILVEQIRKSKDVD